MRPEITIEFDGEEGNSFFIAGKAIAILKDYGLHDEAKEINGIFKRVGSYDELLREVSKLVKIIPITNSAEIHALFRDIEKNK